MSRYLILLILLFPCGIRGESTAVQSPENIPTYVSENKPITQTMDYEKLFDRQLRSYNYVLIGFSVVIGLITAAVIVGGILFWKDRKTMSEEIKLDATKAVKDARKVIDNAKVELARSAQELKEEMEQVMRKVKDKGKEAEEITEEMKEKLDSVSKVVPPEPTPPSEGETGEEKEAGALLGRGNKFYDERDDETAIYNYTKAIDKNPNYAGAFYRRGIAHIRKRDYDSAIRDHTKAIELDPNNVKAMIVTGIAYKEKGDKDKAREWYRKALEKKEYLSDSGEKKVRRWIKELEE